MFRHLFDPKIMNYIIMCMYVLNSAWWASNKDWYAMMYWISAFGITLSVTLAHK